MTYVTAIFATLEHYFICLFLDLGVQDSNEPSPSKSCSDFLLEIVILHVCGHFSVSLFLKDLVRNSLRFELLKFCRALPDSLFLDLWVQESNEPSLQ